MVWKNSLKERPYLKITDDTCTYLPPSILSYNNKRTVSDLAEVRRICHVLQKKGYLLENPFAHRQEKGEVVIIKNCTLLQTQKGLLSDQIKVIAFFCIIDIYTHICEGGTHSFRKPR